MPVTGSCHCGAMACNCSICRRKGYLLHFSSAEKFTLHSDEAATTTYQFNQHNIRHRFCATCGCAPFGSGVGPDGKTMVAINLRCADGIDVDALQIQHFDGASL